MNYEADIEIDESILDVECLDQAKLMLKWSRHQATLQKKEEQAKELLDLEIAELDKKIRSDPEAFGIEKITETVIRNTIIQQAEYEKVNDTHIDARFENNVAKGAVRSMAFRKDMLEALIKLHGQQYFAGPNVPHDLSEMRAHRADDSVKLKRRKT